MEFESLFIIRGIERLAIAGSAIGMIVCGMLLFRWGVGGPSDLVLQAKTFTLRLINGAPGLIVMGFAGFLLWTGLMTPLSSEVSDHTKDGSRKIKMAYSLNTDQTAKLNTFLAELAMLPDNSLSRDQIAKLKNRAIAMQQHLKADNANAAP